MSKRMIGGCLAIAMSVLLQAAPVQAQMMGPGMMGPGYGYGQGRTGFGPGMMGPGMMGYDGGMMGGCPMMGQTGDTQTSSFAEGRIAFLKAELRITDAQKTVWESYAEATKRNLQSMQGMWQTMRAVFDAKTPVERLDAHIAAMDSRVAALKDVKPALTALYGALSDEQKKKADSILTGIGCMM